MPTWQDYIRGAQEDPAVSLDRAVDQAVVRQVKDSINESNSAPSGPEEKGTRAIQGRVR